MERVDSSMNIVDELQRLCNDNTVETVRWNMIGAGEIGDNCWCRIRVGLIEHIRECYPLTSKLSGVSIVSNFNNMTSNVSSMLIQKLLAVVGIYWLPPALTK